MGANQVEHGDNDTVDKYIVHIDINPVPNASVIHKILPISIARWLLPSQ
jgi:hypothetical protein